MGFFLFLKTFLILKKLSFRKVKIEIMSNMIPMISAGMPIGLNIIVTVRIVPIIMRNTEIINRMTDIMEIMSVDPYKKPMKEKIPTPGFEPGTFR